MSIRADCNCRACGARLEAVASGGIVISRDMRLAEAVAAIYAAATAPALWPKTLEAIAAAFGDAGANLFYIRDDGSFGIVVTPSMAAAQREYDQGWWRNDIRTMRAIGYGYGDGVEAITDRHVASEDEMASRPTWCLLEGWRRESQPCHRLRQSEIAVFMAS